MKEGFLDDVFERKSKTADRIGPALIKTGFAATGGLIAGRVDTIASEQWPKSAVAGPLLVALISLGSCAGISCPWRCCSVLTIATGRAIGCSGSASWPRCPRSAPTACAAYMPRWPSRQAHRRM